MKGPLNPFEKFLTLYLTLFGLRSGALTKQKGDPRKYCFSDLAGVSSAVNALKVDTTYDPLTAQVQATKGISDSASSPPDHVC
jgi:hypothetical protein